jgi:hypothetical protein
MFKEENSKAIPTIVCARFEAELNVRFTPHNQVLRDGLELLALKQGEGLGLLAIHVQNFSALLCLVPMKEGYTQRVTFFNNLQPWAHK